MARADLKPDNPAPAAGDKLFTYSAALSSWVLTSLTQLVTYVLAAIPIAWGTWTPAVTLVTNLDGATVVGGSYCRVGQRARFKALLVVDPTVQQSLIRLRLSPPIATTFASAADALGNANGGEFSGAPPYAVGGVFADDATNLIEVQYVPQAAAGNDTLIVTGDMDIV